jgi:hypothetical protein
MVFSVSPTVNVREVDLTTSIPAITTPPAAIAGVFRWGPVNERVLISSEIELANVFGTPTDFNAETFFVAADFLSYSNALFVTRVVDGDAAKSIEDVDTPYFQAKHFGELGDAIEVGYVSVSPSADTDPEVKNNFEDILLDGVADSNIVFGSNVISVLSTEDLNVGQPGAELKTGDILRIGNFDVGFQDLVVTTVASTSEFDANTNVESYTYTITFDRNYTLPETNASNLQFIRRWKYASLFEAAPAVGEFHIVVVDRDGSITGQAGSVIERYDNVSSIPGTKTADGTNRFYADVIAERSSWIEATENSLANVIAREYNALVGGDDGNNETGVSLGAVAKGYDLYKEGNEVDISFILQGKSSINLANYLIANVAEYRRDAVVFISPRRSDVVNVSSAQSQLNNVIAYRSAIQNSSYAFMDSGYKYRYDKYNDVFRWVPLNGDMAGLASLVEPWESPAGFRKGRVRNVIKLAFNPNKSQRDQLYGRDVNPVITQVGQGTVLFGDKTILGTATGSAFTRINVRRLFITVEKAIATISARFLFEFNDEFTQNQFRQIADPFLRDIQGRRGIIDFRVVSDATVNTPQVIDANTFRANIFIKPARSINFIELTFVATRTGVEFEEIVGQQF